MAYYSAENYSVVKNWETPKPSSDDLQFESRFESGNLSLAFRSLVDPHAYVLLLDNDTNTVGYNKWFYFTVSNAKAWHGELARILRPHGWAALLVPITVPETIEDPSVTDPAERLKRFGQEDHVRAYGLDFADRLREAGFTVENVTAADFLLKTCAPKSN